MKYNCNFLLYVIYLTIYESLLNFTLTLKFCIDSFPVPWVPQSYQWKPADQTTLIE